MIVPAFLMKDQPRSHIERITFLNVGQWYAGSSITNGAASPSKAFVFLRVIPETIIAAIPIKYADGATHHAPPKIAPAIIAMNGSFAPQGIKVVVIIVMRLSRSFSIVLDAIIPGTPQPVPIRIGINDLPDKPKRRKILSRTKAIRDIYPQASRKARKINKTKIWGTNPKTAPTPATAPSRIKPESQSAQCSFSSKLPIRTGTPGTQTP